MITFDDFNLSKSYSNALQEAGYIYPTPIQRASFSAIRSGKDLVGVAQTGTGKTLAYLLPLIQDMRFVKNHETKILIIVPTRELVAQVVKEAEWVLANTNFTVKGVFGGANINTQKLNLVEGADILVGTPGRLLDLGLDGAVKMKKIKRLVIDEVDEMMNLGFKTQLNNMFELMDDRRQNIMFSATLSDKVESVIEKEFKNYEKIEVAPHGTPLDQIQQFYYRVPNYYTKLNLLKILLESEELNKVLVFVRTKKIADRLFDALQAFLGEESVAVIHSNKSQNYRFRSVNGFESGQNRILIATDIISRGLDIKSVSHVINFDAPEEAVDYIHRIGRTGRADEDGTSILFVGEDQEESLMEIEALMKKTITPLENPLNLVQVEEKIPEEIEYVRMKSYLTAPTLKHSKGAFHAKKAKNMKDPRKRSRSRSSSNKKARRR